MQILRDTGRHKKDSSELLENRLAPATIIDFQQWIHGVPYHGNWIYHDYEVINNYAISNSEGLCDVSAFYPSVAAPYQRCVVSRTIRSAQRRNQDLNVTNFLVASDRGDQLSSNVNGPSFSRRHHRSRGHRQFGVFCYVETLLSPRSEAKHRRPWTLHAIARSNNMLKAIQIRPANSLSSRLGSVNEFTAEFIHVMQSHWLGRLWSSGCRSLGMLRSAFANG
ncbi:hypothetical protein EDD85DRAFT_788742 [Armillaria nabsnona]|nr:hypothetical protein EDD85DRAFT_788742 [Armillaria nabsnona]